MTFDAWFNKYTPKAPEYLDDCVRAAWEASSLAYQEEIESLRQTIATLNKALTITSECNFKLREQLEFEKREHIEMQKYTLNLEQQLSGRD